MKIKGIEFKERYFNGELQPINTRCLWMELRGKETYNILNSKGNLFISFKGGEKLKYNDLSEFEKEDVLKYLNRTK